MSRLELPDGGWAEICAPRKVTERKRSPYIAAVADLSAATIDLPRNPVDPTQADPLHFGGEHMAAANRITHMLVLALVKEWSYGLVDIDVLEDMPGDAFDRLVGACLPLAADILPQYGEPVPKSVHRQLVNIAYGLVNGGGDLRDERARRYILTFEAHIPPNLQDECSAVELDELLLIHSRVLQFRAEAEKAATR